MKKKVSELSEEEFKKTFPLILKEYSEQYGGWYESEKAVILSAVAGEEIARINHMGSTAISGLISKPTIDILLEVDGSCHLTRLVEKLKAIGYGNEIFTRNEDPLKLLLGKGYSSDGYAEKVFHLHVRYAGNWGELYFRDYLLDHPDVTAAYGELKRNILEGIENGTIQRIVNGFPNGYSQSKLSFVEKYTDLAKQLYQNRYQPV